MLPVSTLEQMLVENDSKYFAKIDSSKIRMAIVYILQLFPLPCRGERMDADLCNLKDDLDEIGKSGRLRHHDSSEELIETLAKKVKETLESDHL